MKIWLIDSNIERLAELEQLLHDCPFYRCVQVPQAIYNKPPAGLDMIFLTLPAAEKWNPNFRSREAQILSTSADEQKKGFPPVIVTGVNLQPNDPKDPLSQVRIVLETAIGAARAYNLENGYRIQNFGFWLMDLTRGVKVGELAQLLHAF